MLQSFEPFAASHWFLVWLLKINPKSFTASPWAATLSIGLQMASRMALPRWISRSSQSLSIHRIIQGIYMVIVVILLYRYTNFPKATACSCANNGPCELGSAREKGGAGQPCLWWSQVPFCWPQVHSSFAPYPGNFFGWYQVLFLLVPGTLLFCPYWYCWQEWVSLNCTIFIENTLDISDTLSLSWCISPWYPWWLHLLFQGCSIGCDFCLTDPRHPENNGTIPTKVHSMKKLSHFETVRAGALYLGNHWEPAPCWQGRLPQVILWESENKGQTWFQRDSQLTFSDIVNPSE